MPKRTISKAATEAGVGIETVRFYERSGVLEKPPAPERGWRHYPESAVWTVRYIKNAQAMGLCLADCKELLHSDARPPLFCRNVRSVVATKLCAIDSEIRRLKSMRKEMTQFLAKCEKREATGGCPIYEHIASTMERKCQADRNRR